MFVRREALGGQRNPTNRFRFVERTHPHAGPMNARTGLEPKWQQSSELHICTTPHHATPHNTPEGSTPRGFYTRGLYTQRALHRALVRKRTPNVDSHQK